MPRDTFDSFDDDLIDDTFPQPVPVQARMGDTEILLRRVVDIIASAPSIPLSSTPRIDRDEVIELLEDALQRLPEEIRQARWMLKERQEFAYEASIRMRDRFLQQEVWQHMGVNAKDIVPLMLQDRCIGVFDLESPDLDAFKKADVEILTLLASHAAVAIENARLYETIGANKARIEKELRFAQGVQAALLPTELPKRMKGVDIAARAYRAALVPCW